jgi:RNA polymerase sigma-70 factor (ECF subfamily)
MSYTDSEVSTGGARLRSGTSANLDLPNRDRRTTEIDMAMRVDPDRDLVTALCGRGAKAAEALVTAYGDRAYRLAARITGNQQDAEEAVQDAFWSVVRKIDTFRGDSAFGSWVYRIVSNAAYGKIRRRPKGLVRMALDEGLAPCHAEGHEGLSSDWSSRVVDPAGQTELRSALSVALAELPAHYRAVMVLHDVEGFSMAEIADALEISVPAAKSRAHRARLSLRRRLSMCGNVRQFRRGISSGAGRAERYEADEVEERPDRDTSMRCLDRSKGRRNALLAGV